MKILLVGEYSGVHTNLAKELKGLGHQVYVISDGDGYKKIGEPDLFITYAPLTSKVKFFSFILSFYYTLMEFLGLKGFLHAIKYLKEIKDIKNYEVVQLINTRPFSNFSSLGNFILLYFLFKNNKKVFLCALGDDYTWVKYCLEGNPPYSKFDRLKLKNMSKFFWSLVYVYGIGFNFLDKYVIGRSQKIIPGLFDYYIAYKNSSYSNKLSDVIPLPADFKKNYNCFEFKGYPVKIFHGWQPGRELAKGNDIFDKAIKKLKIKYPDKVEYEIIGGIPYEEYLTKFEESTIYIDQCYSLDRGMNAILGMSAGKVVFSGFDKETIKYYGVNDSNQSLINALPDCEEIFFELERLIINPNILENISREAIFYIKRHHNGRFITEKYLDVWGN